MKETKFRAWTGKEMLYLESNDKEHNHYLQVGSGGFYLYHSTDGELKTCTKQGGILMQYTGLKDKNGIEIYAGDVVQDYRFPKGQKVVVQWDKFGWLPWVGEYEGDGSEGVPSLISATIIIGNIHENPELIK